MPHVEPKVRRNCNAAKLVIWSLKWTEEVPLLMTSLRGLPQIPYIIDSTHPNIRGATM